MTFWVAVLVVGLGSYLFRVTPLLLGDRLRIAPRAQGVLRHAGVGGVAALVVFGIRDAGIAGPSGSVLPALCAVVVAGMVAYRGRSMGFVLVVGGCVYGAAGVAVAAFG